MITSQKGVCKNCGKDISRYTPYGSWVHAETYAVLCYSSTIAEPRGLVSDLSIDPWKQVPQ